MTTTDPLAPVREHVATHGWHVAGILPDPGRLGWTYTIGLATTTGHPDLVVSGLDPGAAAVLLNDLGDAIRQGLVLRPHDRLPGYLADVDVEFRPVLSRWVPAHFGRALDWYGSEPAMLAVALPDRHNRFPEEPGSEAGRFQLHFWSEKLAPHRLAHPHAATPGGLRSGHRMVVDDLLGAVRTGWEEEVLVTLDPADARVATVHSVPFVDWLSYGDRVTVVKDAAGELGFGAFVSVAPVATARVSLLGSGDQLRRDFDALLDTAEAVGVPWESPLPRHLFFAVAHERYDDFVTYLLTEQERGAIATTVVRAPG
jgi:hypothetical protein